MSYVEYNSNNSGGSWWLTDDDWRALEEAGWIIEWATLYPKYGPDRHIERDPETGVPVLTSVFPERSIRRPDENGRWLGALATKAYRPGMSLRDAVDEWERITNQTATDAGCPCCGQPHDFTEYDTAGNYVTSGPDINYTASW